MIARSFVLFVLLILLPDLYLYRRFVRHGQTHRLLGRLLLFVPSFVLLVFTLWLALEPNFAPENINTLFLYLLLFGLLVLPKAVFAAASLAFSRVKMLPPLLALLTFLTVLYGSFVGSRQFRVRRVEIVSPNLPPSFDGYRAVLFSDAHVGTLTGGRQALLRQAVDSMNALQADAIFFAGDLQNMTPSEVYAQLPLLRSLHARDGVFSVLGNHDYPQYVRLDSAGKKAFCEEVCRLHRLAGWHLLCNSHLTLRRQADSLVVAGTENDGPPNTRFPSKGDLGQALEGVGPEAFTVLLQHDPTSWRRSVLPHGHVDLTLSGHTHGGQVSLMGWKPVKWIYSELDGHFTEQDCQLYVTSGLGGLIPFRIGLPGEIVLMTLRRASRQSQASASHPSANPEKP